MAAVVAAGEYMVLVPPHRDSTAEAGRDLMIAMEEHHKVMNRMLSLVAVDCHHME